MKTGSFYDANFGVVDDTGGCHNYNPSFQSMVYPLSYRMIETHNLFHDSIVYKSPQLTKIKCWQNKDLPSKQLNVIFWKKKEAMH